MIEALGRAAGIVEHARAKRERIAAIERYLVVLTARVAALESNYSDLDEMKGPAGQRLWHGYNMGYEKKARMWSDHRVEWDRAASNILER